MIPLIVMCLFICLIDCSGLVLTGRVRDLLYADYYNSNEVQQEVETEEDDVDVSDDVDEVDEIFGTRRPPSTEDDDLWGAEEPKSAGSVNEILIADDDEMDEEDLALMKKMRGEADPDKSAKDAHELINSIYGGSKR